MNRMKKKITGIALMGALLLSSNTVKADKVPLKINREIAQVTKDNGKPVSKGQIWIKNLPLNSDFYGLWEKCNGSDLYKFRLSLLPIKYKSFSLGVAVQHVDKTNFNAHNDLGLSLRINGKLNRKTFGKIDLRYFPKERTIDSYAFISRKKLFLDCISSYNHETDSAMFVPGIDYKLNKNCSIGLESKFTGKIKVLQTRYTGMRFKLKF